MTQGDHIMQSAMHNRTARGGRPTRDQVEARPEAFPARYSPDGKLLCPHCGRPTLRCYGTPRKSDNALPVRCEHCGARYARCVRLEPLRPGAAD